MIRFEKSRSPQLAQEFRVAIDRRLRAIVLGLEFFCYNKFRVPHLLVLDIRRNEDENRKRGGEPNSLHLLDPSYAIDIDAANLPEEYRKEIISEILALGAAKTRMLRKHSGGEHLHLEIGLKI